MDEAPRRHLSLIHSESPTNSHGCASSNSQPNSATVGPMKALGAFRPKAEPWMAEEVKRQLDKGAVSFAQWAQQTPGWQSWFRAYLESE